MPLGSVLVLYNRPVLAPDHPEADAEASVLGVAEEARRALESAGYRVAKLGLASDPTALWRALKTRKPDVVFNLFEGNADNTQTESFVAGLLEWSGIPYTGSPFAALSLARAKHTAKHLLKGAGLPTADFIVVNALPLPKCPLKFPVFIKPAEQDGSVGIDQQSVCTNRQQLTERVTRLLKAYGPPVLVEEYIPGREFNIALLELPTLIALPPAEVILPDAKSGAWSILTYDGKWDVEERPRTYAVDLGKAKMRAMSELAAQAYRLIGCRDYARVDFRLTPEGKPYILEVNPNPEISAQAGFAGCPGSTSQTNREFMISLVRQAFTRRK
jgi:D-alanine-D-alanine ligase